MILLWFIFMAFLYVPLIWLLDLVLFDREGEKDLTFTLYVFVFNISLVWKRHRYLYWSPVGLFAIQIEVEERNNRILEWNRQINDIH